MVMGPENKKIINIFLLVSPKFFTFQGSLKLNHNCRWQFISKQIYLYSCYVLLQLSTHPFSIFLSLYGSYYMCKQIATAFFLAAIQNAHC